MIEQIIANPMYLAIVVGGGAAAGGVLLYREFGQDDGVDEIETEGMHQRLKKIFTDATESQGSKVGDYIKQRGTSNTPQLVGYAVRAKDHSVKVLKWKEDEEDFKPESVEGTTYTVLEGSGKLGILPKRFLNVFLDLTETYDAPQSIIAPGDDYIWFTPEAHFIKYNGVKRQLSPEGMGRMWDSSFAGLHENYLDTLQSIPETYSILNNRVAGQLHIDNNKSENIRKFKKGEEREEKDLE